MSHYLLSTYQIEGEVPGAPSPEDMQEFLGRVIALEAEMDAAGAFVFGGGLADPTSAAVFELDAGSVVMTDGPFAESKEHIAGFYIIDAADLDDALAWAKKVVTALDHPIEVRPFRATGRVADQMGEMPGTNAGG